MSLIPGPSQEDTLVEGKTIHSSILAWRIPWIEEPGGLQSLWLQRAEHHWSDWAHIQCVKKKFALNKNSSVQRKKKSRLQSSCITQLLCYNEFQVIKYRVLSKFLEYNLFSRYIILLNEKHFIGLWQKDSKEEASPPSKRERKKLITILTWFVGGRDDNNSLILKILEIITFSESWWVECWTGVCNAGGI